ncbi:SanA protein [Clostridiales bacterium COT073_COT-073]|nr:SanA protein [Clostridiales bacterium COT073_COT-073]
MNKNKSVRQSREIGAISLLCQTVKKIIVFLIKVILGLGLSAILLILGINGYMVLRTGSKILNLNHLKAEAAKGQFDYILVLGAGVRPNGEPSPMLKERIDKGVQAYQLLETSPLLMSGDSADRYYKETTVMVNKAIEQGVPAEDIQQDQYGISTYDSIWRFKKIFQGKKVLIVTQGYHLSRSLYLAQCFDLDAYGLDAQKIRYNGQLYRDVRELMARVKDFGLGIWQPPAKHTD